MIPKDNEAKRNHADEETQARREFLKKIGKGSATIPAAVLLLAASAKQASAGGGSGSGGGPSGGCGSG